MLGRPTESKAYSSSEGHDDRQQDVLRELPLSPGQMVLQPNNGDELQLQPYRVAEKIKEVRTH